MEPASGTQEAFWTAYDILAPALMVAMGYATVWLTGVIRQRIRNDVVAGLLSRLTVSVATAVKAVNQQQREILGHTRSNDSPGGRKLTKQEAALLKGTAIAHVKEYWGPKGLKELARILVGGERDPGKASSQLHRTIGTMVEAAVHDSRRQRQSSIVTRLPAVWNGGPPTEG